MGKKKIWCRSIVRDNFIVSASDKKPTVYQKQNFNQLNISLHNSFNIFKLYKKQTIFMEVGCLKTNELHTGLQVSGTLPVFCIDFCGFGFSWQTGE